MADPSRMELVVVAIPREDDYVWKVSSEPIPHMTLLYLGQVDWTPEQVDHAAGFIEHAASQLSRFGMSVDRRGKLGDKDADVLFFDKSFSQKRLEQFRSNLLVDRDINIAYLGATQYPSWTPHLTLGYPETPAKPDKRDYGFNWVEFDKIALWTGESEGPTFQLKSFDNDLEVAMSTADLGAAFLEHYGVKGMRWGKHLKDGPQAVTTTHKGRRLVTRGGGGHTPHEDATRAATATRIATKSGTHALSNKELQAAVQRMNLEKQFNQLNPKKGPIAAGQKFVKVLLGLGKTSNEVIAYTNSPAGQAIREQFNKRS